MNYAPKLVPQLPISNTDLLDAFVEACIRVTLIAIVGEGASRTDDVISWFTRSAYEVSAAKI